MLCLERQWCREQGSKDMDAFTIRHLGQWVDSQLPNDGTYEAEREEMRSRIVAYVDSDPECVDRYSWSQIAKWAGVPNF
jgi:hypothetical protein